jgi:hypothetical protein
MALIDDAVFDENTLEMKVENTGFIVDRMGQDCAPLQYLRELTQNSIEAILATPEKHGEVVWDLDWVEFDLSGRRKLCVIDTGVGMTGPEIAQYINRLSSSVHLQALDGNYGVGAKIAGATRHHAGMLYLSWKSGRGEMAHLWRDPASGKYGLRQLHTADFPHWAPVEDAVKPDDIDQHGTKVVLLGMDDDADTMAAPDGAAAPSRWVARYLNTRYFRFPAGVTVKSRQGWEYPRSDTARNLLQRVHGQEWFLSRHSAAHGSVTLTGAEARWWILNDDKVLSQQSGSFATAGHVAALYRDELYEMQTGRAGVARLQQFGVLFGSGRVVLYLEPAGDVGTNTARTQLLIGRDPLPWADWAAEFRSKMPTEIERHMEEVVSPTPDADRKTAIRERLKRIEDLIKLDRYRRTPSGDVLVGDEDQGAGGASSPSRERGSGTARSGGVGGRAGSVYALFIQEEGDPADPTRGSVYPRVDWVSVENGKREPGDLDDRAARYLHDQNRLLINADFRVFTQMIDRWTGRYGGGATARQTVTDVVQEWFEQALVETVLSAQSIGGRMWTVDDVKALLSEEALTAVVLPRYHIDNAVTRALGSKLGTLKGKEAS